MVEDNMLLTLQGITRILYSPYPSSVYIEEVIFVKLISYTVNCLLGLQQPRKRLSNIPKSSITLKSVYIIVRRTFFLPSTLVKRILPSLKYSSSRISTFIFLLFSVLPRNRISNRSFSSYLEKNIILELILYPLKPLLELRDII
jgi:hypothetical protein